jgi:2-(1,2-epoxy-1,2-dihydrophenyl)acetyl-CoA isomerase
MKDVLYEERGRIAIVTLNRPDALNAFSRDMRLGVIEAFDRCARVEHVRAVVLTGAGRGFSAGADLSAGATSGAQIAAALNDEHNPGIRAIAELPKPVIAAVNGFATGIGAAYALACDMVFFGEKAFLQVPFARIGLVPDGGLTWQLAERLGPRLAFEVAIGGERLSAERCVELGLANRVVADEALLEQACIAAERLAECAPLAVAGAKRLLRRAPQLGLAGAMREETDLQARCVESADCREGVRAFFEKRAPKFSGN